MNINLFKVMTEAMKHTSVRLVNKIKDKNDNKLPEWEVDKISPQNILNQEYGTDYVEALIEGVIVEYHNQLRKKLLESGIDIEEIEF